MTMRHSALLDGTVMAFVARRRSRNCWSTARPDTLAIAGDQPLRTTVEAFAVPQGEQIFLTYLGTSVGAALVAALGLIEQSALGEERLLAS